MAWVSLKGSEPKARLLWRKEHATARPTQIPCCAKSRLLGMASNSAANKILFPLFLAGAGAKSEADHAVLIAQADGGEVAIHIILALNNLF